MKRSTIVFVGPTLPAAEVAARLRDAIVAGPVAVGDVLELAQRRSVARIAIIDGYFERMAAVWHKEILVALARGIAVLGAASMGALRAAELAPFGMVGVGAIYQAYRRGELIGDDEVAVAHLPAEYGYRATSDALVNLRDGIAHAPGLGAKTRARLVELAQRRFYRERTWAQLLADARAARVPARQLALLEAFCARAAPDRKAADARLLVRRLARPSAKPEALRVPRTWALRQLEELVASRKSPIAAAYPVESHSRTVQRGR